MLPKQESVPSLKNWKFTIQGFERLWQRLQEFGITEFYTRNVNQDSSECVFSCVRSCSTATKPNPYQFKQSFKTLLIRDQVKPATGGTNCEFDLNNSLFSTFKDFLGEKKGFVESEATQTQYMYPSKLDLSEEILKFHLKPQDIANCILKELSCNDCTTSMSSTEFESTIFSACCPYLKYIGQIINYQKLQSFVSSKIVNNISFSWLYCTEHLEHMKTSLSKNLSVFLINLWCNEMNAALKNSKQTTLEKDQQILIKITKKSEKAV